MNVEFMCPVDTCILTELISPPDLEDNERNKTNLQGPQERWLEASSLASLHAAPQPLQKLRLMEARAQAARDVWLEPLLLVE